jgi:hypothetical protein
MYVQLEGDGPMVEFKLLLLLVAGRGIQRCIIGNNSAAHRWFLLAPLPVCGGVVLCCVCC